MEVLSHAHLNLSEVIRSRIMEEGPISFREFMDMALYYPGSGYYTSVRKGNERWKDYYTSPQVDSIFGETIAKQLMEMWNIMGRGQFLIVEMGGADGSMAVDILAAIEKNPEFFECIQYHIVEKKLPPFTGANQIFGKKIHWHKHLTDVPEFEGCLLSNELIDNFPVHRVAMENNLEEIFVDFCNGSWIERKQKAHDALIGYFNQLGVVLPNGYRTEINLVAIDWLKEITEKMKRGYIITIDYGFSSNEMYSPKRSQGTLVCYHQHAINDSPYQFIGEQDITAHVNFSALRHWGEVFDLKPCGFTSQLNFLRGLGLSGIIKRKEKEGSFKNLEEVAFFINHFIFEMGSQFKVLIQEKSLANEHLSGLQFTQRLI